VTDGLHQVLGEIDVSLEGRFRHVRTKETNLGNLVTDIMRRKMRTDVALLNSGTLRSDVVHDPGPFRMKVSLIEESTKQFLFCEDLFFVRTFFVLIDLSYSCILIC